MRARDDATRARVPKYSGPAITRSAREGAYDRSRTLLIEAATPRQSIFLVDVVVLVVEIDQLVVEIVEIVLVLILVFIEIVLVVLVVEIVLVVEVIILVVEVYVVVEIVILVLIEIDYVVSGFDGLNVSNPSLRER